MEGGNERAMGKRDYKAKIRGKEGERTDLRKSVVLTAGKRLGLEEDGENKWGSANTRGTRRVVSQKVSL